MTADLLFGAAELPKLLLNLLDSRQGSLRFQLGRRTVP
jgi:hypothetical protein